jgi:hypothetical protein
MQKNYYLLRNNLESGPYTIDELLLQQLQPTDLVWVEGRMNAWCHPSELEELTTTYSINKNAKQKKSSRPIPRITPPARPAVKTKEDIESRAEEIRKNILMQSEQIQKNREIKVENEQTPTSFKLDEDAIEVVFHRKNRVLPGAHFSAAAVMVLIISAVWFGKDIWIKNAQTTESLAVLRSSGENLEQVNQLPRQAKVITLAQLDFPQQEPVASAPTDASAESEAVLHSTPAVTTSRPAEPIVANSTPKVEAERSVRTEPVQKKEEESTAAGLKEVVENKEKDVVKKDSQVKKDVVKEVKPTEIKKDSSVAKDESSQEVEETGKKKGFGQVIKGIFKKKKKSNEEGSEEQE